MTYEQIVETVKNSITKSSIRTVDTHVAVEFDIYGEGEGAFYVEINNGAVSVEPYEYYDRDAKVIITGDELVKLTSGEKSASESMEEGILMLEGDENAVNTLFALFVKNEKPKAAKKPVEKKPIAKKPVKPVAKPQAAEKKPAPKAKAETNVKVEKTIVETAKKPNKPVAKDIKK